MKKVFTIALAFVAITTACYYLMVYVNPLLGFIGIGLGINTLDKIFIGAE